MAAGDALVVGEREHAFNKTCGVPRTEGAQALLPESRTDRGSVAELAAEMLADCTKTEIKNLCQDGDETTSLLIA